MSTRPSVTHAPVCMPVRKPMHGQVRGAYLHLERRRAEALGCPSPVWGSLEETHASFNRCLEVRGA